MNAVLTYVAKKQLLKKSDMLVAYVCVWKNSLRSICDAHYYCLLSFKSNAFLDFHTICEGSLCGFPFAQNLTIKVSFVSTDLSAVFKSKMYASFPVKTYNYMGW